MSRHEPGRGGPGDADGLAHPGLTRRAVVVAPLAVAAASAMTSCTGRSEPPGPSPAPAPTPVDPDDALRAAASARELDLLRAYDAVLAGLPELAARLGPLRAHHEEHLRALLGPASPSASPSAPVPPAAAAPPPAEVALRSLVVAERTAGGQHADDCLAASRRLAGLLASLSASELTHAAALA